MAKKIFGALLFLLVAIVMLSTVATKQATPARAAGNSDLSGWAWSSNIGWISFNSANNPGGSPVSFKVTLNSDNTLSGYAWSSNIGWIQFGPGLTGPAGNSNQVVAQVSGTNVIGWAKAVAGGSAQAGGWDGWISLGGSNYGVKVQTNSDGSRTFYGFAWGGDVVGWVNFDASVPAGGTPPNQPCDPAKEVCVTTTNSFTATCNPTPPSPETPNTTVTWTAIPSTVGNYTYQWTNASPGSPPSQASANVGSGSSYNVSVLITDTSSNQTYTCQNTVAISACTQPSINPPNPNCTCPNPPTWTCPGTGPTLQMVGNNNRISIIQQSKNTPATTRAVELQNTGTGSETVRVTSIKDRFGVDAWNFHSDVTGAKCRLTNSPTVTSDSQWQNCNTVSVPLNSGNDPNNFAYFSIKIPGYLKEINDNSPYKVTLQGIDNKNNVVSLTDSNGNPTAVIFEYLVGGVNPK